MAKIKLYSDGSYSIYKFNDERGYPLFGTLRKGDCKSRDLQFSGMSDASEDLRNVEADFSDPAPLTPDQEKTAKAVSKVNKGRDLKAALRKPFLWQTDDGDLVKPCDMASPHLVNTIKMLWNNTVPPLFRVGPFIRRAAVLQWHKQYVEVALSELLNEASCRADLEEPFRSYLQDILLNKHCYDRIRRRISL